MGREDGEREIETEGEGERSRQGGKEREGEGGRNERGGCKQDGSHSLYNLISKWLLIIFVVFHLL